MVFSTQIAVLQSMQIGTPRSYAREGTSKEIQRCWETSFFRQPDARPRWLYTTHLEGNSQADTKHHGTPGQALLLYAAEHYPLWQDELNRSEMGPGGFGENFTLDGLSEHTACIGDVYELGEARIQVTGPRYPCWKIERRWGIEGLTARVAESGRTGWYCRVLQEGLIEPGMPVLLRERPYPAWTVALVNDFGHWRNDNVALARELATCPALADFWQKLVVRRAQGIEEID